MARACAAQSEKFEAQLILINEILGMFGGYAQYFFAFRFSAR